MTEDAATPAESVITTSARSLWLRRLGLVAVIVGLLYAGWYFVTQSGRQHTDNAYVGADTATVTPLVSGAIVDLRAGNTQMVHKGDVLAVLDDADARIDVASAEAALTQARQHFAQAQTGGSTQAAKLDARSADIAQARARVESASADVERAQLEYRRRAALVAAGAVSAEEVSNARSALIAAQAALTVARANVSTANATRAAAVGDLETSQVITRGQSAATNPDVSVAQARLDKARIDLARTTIRAPIDGVVSQRMVQLGQRVAAGTPLMMIVPVASAYVDANFKETQLRGVKIGQLVTLTSDYYGSGVVFHGKVTGLAGGTGAAFALIPAQNATGNWVKVVQRLPVRVALVPSELRDHPLRVGLSMDAEIDMRDR